MFLNVDVDKNIHISILNIYGKLWRLFKLINKHFTLLK